MIRLDRSLLLLYRFSGYVAATFLIAIALLVLASIITRLLSTYIPGLNEYSGYAMAASSFLALAYTFEQRGHIRVEVLISHLSPSKRWFAELWALTIGSVITVFLAVSISKLTFWSWKFQERSEGADAILVWKPQLMVMIGSIILAICLIHHLFKFITQRFDSAPKRLWTKSD